MKKIKINSKTIPEIIDRVRSGVVSISLLKEEKKISSGSGFLCKNRLVSNHHVFFDPDGNPLIGCRVRIHFGDNQLTSEQEVLEFSYEEFMKRLKAGSEEKDYDYAVFDVSEINYKSRYVFLLGDHKDIREGQKTLLMGYPFGGDNLTSHVGYVSSIYNDGKIDIIQLDASTNVGNSGGPLIDIKTKKTIGIVTRKQTGLADQFDELIKSFGKNTKVLSQMTGRIKFGGLDLMGTFLATQKQMEVIAISLKRASNTGIGYAFSCSELKKENFYK